MRCSQYRVSSSCPRGLLTLGLVALVALASCEEEKPEEKASTIGTAGGIVMSDDGLLSVDIPAGAISGDVEITIEKTTDVPAGHLGPAYELGPSGMTFQKPVELTFSYGGLDLGESTPEELVVQTVINGSWAPVPLGDLNKEAQTITGLVPHFSPYSLGLPPAPSSDNSEAACLCNTSVWEECCHQSGPLDTNLPNSWVTIAEPEQCGCANADWYELFSCYLGKTGYEPGGCTRCESDCCHNSGGYTIASNYVCSCSRSEADSCFKSCAAAGNDQTKCEQLTSAHDPDQGLSVFDQGLPVFDQGVPVLDQGIADSGKPTNDLNFNAIEGGAQIVTDGGLPPPP